MNGIIYEVARSSADLTQILSLQKANLPTEISKQEAQKEGFVTIEHNIDLLLKIAGPYAHIIAKFEGEVVGYALVMERACSMEIPVLIPMFEQIEKIIYKGNPLKNARFFIMGQVCIKKGFRGKGLFKGLYHALQQNMKSDFDYIITDISSRNKRSIKAHEKVGFEIIKEYQQDDENWIIVLLSLHQ